MAVAVEVDVADIADITDVAAWKQASKQAPCRKKALEKKPSDRLLIQIQIHISVPSFCLSLLPDCAAQGR